jgi:hypothetical protein
VTVAGRGLLTPAAVGLGIAAVALGTIVPAAGPVAANPGTSRAVLVAVSTTTVEPPTTTLPVSTTTTPPSTTTTTVPATTSTPSTSTSTTTTTAPVIAPAPTSASETPWLLIGVIVALVAAIVLVAMILRSRRKRSIEADWHRAVVPALSDAQLARQSLLSGNAVSDDAQLRGAVEVQVEKAAAALEHAVSTAPDPPAGAMATSAASALRGLAFAIEADRLLRHGTSAPSGQQLAQADEARRARNTELSTALARLSSRIGSKPGP